MVTMSPTCMYSRNYGNMDRSIPGDNTQFCCLKAYVTESMQSVFVSV